MVGCWGLSHLSPCCWGVSFHSTLPASGTWRSEPALKKKRLTEPRGIPEQSRDKGNQCSYHHPPGSRQGVMSIRLTFQNNLCLFCSWQRQWGPGSKGAPWEGAGGDSWLVPGTGADGTSSWALLVRNLGKSPLRKCISPRFLSGRDPSGVLAAQAACPKHLFSPQVCPPAQLTWGMTWGTRLRHDDCALVWAAALLWDTALTLRVLLWQSNRDTSLCMDRISRQEATISYCTEQKEDIYIYLCTHNDFSLSRFQRTRPRNHSQHSHSCRLCHFLAAHPQPWWLWQVHCLLQPHQQLFTTFTSRDHLSGTDVLWHTHMHIQSPVRN